MWSICDFQKFVKSEKLEKIGVGVAFLKQFSFQICLLEKRLIFKNRLLGMLSFNSLCSLYLYNKNNR